MSDPVSEKEETALRPARPFRSMQHKAEVPPERRLTPLKFTPECCQRVIDAIKIGGHISTACVYAGISSNTLDMWLRRGKKDEDGPFREFYKAFKLSLAEAELHMVRLIREQAEGFTYKRKTVTTYADGSQKTVEEEIPVREWTAAAWMLERRHASRWSKKIHGEISGEVRHKMAVAVYIPTNDRDPTGVMDPSKKIRNPDEAA